MLLLSIFLYFVTSLLACLVLLKKITFTRAVISFFITFFSINVLVSEILSLVGWLNKGWAFLALQVIFCIGICLSLFLSRKAELSSLIKTFLPGQNPFKVVNYFFLAIIVSVMGTLLFVGLGTPPNNLDSLHTHLLRIYYWLQHGSLVNWNATGIVTVYD